MKAPYSMEAARESADAVRNRVGDGDPDIAIVLGSGLGGLAETIEDSVWIPFVDIPGFPAASVVGHAGAMVWGKLGNRRVVALSGRIHVYEGHSPALAAFPIRVMNALGARTLFTSNAAGAIREAFVNGDLMIINDHLNLTFTNPLTGAAQEGEERFVDMSAPYDAALRDALRRAGERNGVALKEGVYAWMPGPTFETRAEVKMLRTLGADAVGMSTVPEVIVARALKMRVAAMSCITNEATASEATPVLHTDVLDVAARAAKSFQSVVRSFVEDLPAAK
jgi:purine-nucleoside phosphorylase